MPETAGKIVSWENLDSSTQGLIKSAASARELAYAPFSKFKVGCALITRKGDVYTGCNVENSSYGLSICAERTAIVKAVSSGDADIVQLAIVADMDNSVVTPCGACRQFINEFSSKTNIVVYCSNESKQKILEITNTELLPWGFRLHD